MISSTLIVALWFLPVTLFILIPLAICFCWLAYQAVRDLAAGDIPFAAYFSTRHYVEGKVQRRREPRVPLNERLVAVVSDGRTSFTAMVTNVSRMGMCLSDLTGSMPISRQMFSVLITAGAQQLELVAEPRWQADREQNSSVVGMQITDSPTLWNDFVFSR